MCACVPSHFRHVLLFETLWTVARQALLYIGLSRRECWNGLPYLIRLPCPPPGNLPDSGIEPASLMYPALAGRFFTTSATWEAHDIEYASGIYICIIYVVIYYWRSPWILICNSRWESPESLHLKWKNLANVKTWWGAVSKMLFCETLHTMLCRGLSIW